MSPKYPSAPAHVTAKADDFPALHIRRMQVLIGIYVAASGPPSSLSRWREAASHSFAQSRSDPAPRQNPPWKIHDSPPRIRSLLEPIRGYGFKRVSSSSNVSPASQLLPGFSDIDIIWKYQEGRGQCHLIYYMFVFVLRALFDLGIFLEMILRNNENELLTLEMLLRKCWLVIKQGIWFVGTESTLSHLWMTS